MIRLQPGCVLDPLVIPTCILSLPKPDGLEVSIALSRRLPTNDQMYCRDVLLSIL